MGYENSAEWEVCFYSARTTATVYARDVDDSYQYWMESYPIAPSVAQWSIFSGWRTQDVLRPQRIPSSLIGVTVSLGSSDLAPAFVFPADHPPGNMSVNSYDLRLRSGLRLDEVRYAVSETDRRHRTISRKVQVNNRGSSSFLLRLDVHTLNEGPAYVFIEGFRNGTVESVSTFTFRFFHKQVFQFGHSR